MKKEKKDVDMELLRRIEELEEENKRLRNKDIQEVENPYTVTNRVVDELVTPQDTMYYLTGEQANILLSAKLAARIPTLFGEPEVEDLSWFADHIRDYLVSKGGRGRRDILRVLRASSGQVRENVNKSLFKQLLHGGKDSDMEEDGDG
ncbi:hypothetical protein RQ359_000964 [Sulfuracidifex metallicus DSM 6482 = JCM 9184]|uniref:Uncharacterized protein n=2 Tax=Sulfuracidifex metallicus TaxID=47303 RepID=A0A6A9QRN3_SULME|nr:hypothetical protein [Sulfuracidifex metallicus DSM 6482 = JCM 9184]WOE51644.1 hypothetical protein RQ359_000964 [Sulfuracidifex metallicus DSM 6482 = JCM 9184]